MMTWFIDVSCYILKGMILSVDSFEEFKKNLDRLIDDAKIVRYENGQGLVLVNLYGRYVYCNVIIDNNQNLIIQHSEEDKDSINIATIKAGRIEEMFYPDWFEALSDLR